jgi:hypothetical protein
VVAHAGRVVEEVAEFLADLVLLGAFEGYSRTAAARLQIQAAPSPMMVSWRT